MRRWLCLYLLLSACQAPDHEVAITLQNDSDQTLRCLLVFAHWMTEELPPLPADGQTEIFLQRQPLDGALYKWRGQAQKLPLENISCGFEADWRPDAIIGLLPLQREGVTQATLQCVQQDRLVCQFLK